MSYPKTLDAGLNSSHDRETTGAKLELVWEMEGFDLTSITSYTDTESTRITDVDLTPFWFFKCQIIMLAYAEGSLKSIIAKLSFSKTIGRLFKFIFLFCPKEKILMII